MENVSPFLSSDNVRGCVWRFGSKAPAEVVSARVRRPQSEPPPSPCPGSESILLKEIVDVVDATPVRGAPIPVDARERIIPLGEDLGLWLDVAHSLHS